MPKPGEAEEAEGLRGVLRVRAYSTDDVPQSKGLQDRDVDGKMHSVGPQPSNHGLAVEALRVGEVLGKLRVPAFWFRVPAFLFRVPALGCRELPDDSLNGPGFQLVMRFERSRERATERERVRERERARANMASNSRTLPRSLARKTERPCMNICFPNNARNTRNRADSRHGSVFQAKEDCVRHYFVVAVLYRL